MFIPKKTTMNKLLLLIIIFLSITSFSRDKQSYIDEVRYREIARKNYTIKEINNLIVLYKDSLLTTKNKDPRKTAFYNLVISKLYYKLGGYNNSISFGKIAIQDYKNIKDTFFIVSSLTNIGAIYGELQERKIAYDYFKQIEKYAIESKDTVVLAYNYINLGVAISKNDTKKALAYFEKAKSVLGSKKIGDLFYFNLLVNKANVLYNLKEYNKAKQIYLKLLSKIDSTHFFYGDMVTNLAQSYYKLGIQDSALYYSKLALYHNPEMHNFTNLANTYSVITDIYLSLNNTDSAKYFLEKYKAYTDSVIIKKKTEYTSKLKVVYETDKLLSNIEEQKHEIEKSNMRLIYMSIALVITIIGILIFIFYYRKLQLSYKNIVKESVKSIKLEEKITSLEKKLNKEAKTTKKENINIENADEIFAEILRLLEEEKLFTDKDFDINKLANILNTNRTYISKIINSKTGKSFVNLVNSYRVKEAKLMLINESNKNITLNAIGEMAGFKSAPTFYRVFKQETGITPMFYMKNKNAL